MPPKQSGIEICRHFYHCRNAAKVYRKLTALKRNISFAISFCNRIYPSPPFVDTVRQKNLQYAFSLRVRTKFKPSPRGEAQTGKTANKPSPCRCERNSSLRPWEKVSRKRRMRGRCNEIPLNSPQMRTASSRGEAQIKWKPSLLLGEKVSRKRRMRGKITIRVYYKFLGKHL